MPRRSAAPEIGLAPVPCARNAELERLIRRYAEVLRELAHTLGDHGLAEDDFYRSGVFRGAIERLRGQFSATMREKRDFVRRVLARLEDDGHIAEWNSAESANRHDFVVETASGKRSVVELKGCLDGNNTNIFERTPHAQEFVLWSLCSNPSADPRHNVWSGVHTQLSAEIMARNQRVDGLIVWDWLCGTSARPGCPKSDRAVEIGPWRLPPPRLYVFPDTVAHPRNNPLARAQTIASVELLSAFAKAFSCRDEEIFHVSFEARYRGHDIERRTIIERSGRIVSESDFTPIQRA